MGRWEHYNGVLAEKSNSSVDTVMVIMCLKRTKQQTKTKNKVEMLFIRSQFKVLISRAFSLFSSVTMGHIGSSTVFIGIMMFAFFKL